MLQEITEKKKILMEKSSMLEQILYALLGGHQLNLTSSNPNLNNIEKIGLVLLNNTRNTIESLIQKEQNSDNSFQFHYSKNLLELTIMTLADEEFEQSNISSFLETRGLKEALVLSIATPKVDLSKQTATESKIDNLINHIYIKNDRSFTKQFIEAIQEADEIIEIFVIEKCYEKLIDFHPVPNTKMNMQLLTSTIKKYNYRIELKIKRQFFIWAFLILFILGGVITYLIPTYWSQYDFGILTTITNYLFPILTFLLVLYFFLFHKIEDKFSIITNYIEKRKRKINKKYGIDLEQIEEIEKLK
ncbi:hypothetical protein [Maribacter caenipelagi]|nr:hypothetical protein [Maribacter caenipelagi]